jgi:hypothetical protein
MKSGWFEALIIQGIYDSDAAAFDKIRTGSQLLQSLSYLVLRRSTSERRLSRRRPASS